MRPFALFLIAVLWLGTAHARKPPAAYVGDLVVPQTVQEVERLCRRYNAVEGDLVITGDVEMADLRALQCLRRVTGRLIVRNTHGLKRLDGLALDQMGGVPLLGIEIVDNADLVDVAGIEGGTDLATAGVTVRGNPLLVEVKGLPPVVSGANVVVADNLSLASVDGPPGFRRSVALGDVYIGNNPRLDQIDGFLRVTAAESIAIRANARLRTLGGFARLTDVRTLELVALPMLSTWSAHPSLATVGRLTVDQVDGLSSLPGFPDLNRAKRIELTHNASLASIAGLSVSQTTFPTVDHMVVTGNPMLPAAAVERLTERLHLPGGAGNIEFRSPPPPQPTVESVVETPVDG